MLPRLRELVEQYDGNQPVRKEAEKVIGILVNRLMMIGNDLEKSDDRTKSSGESHSEAAFAALLRAISQQ